MKLSVWAKSQGISYMTAWNWFHADILPVKAYQLPNGTIIVQDSEKSNEISENEKIFIYARVSSHNKKDDLERQIARCEEFARAKGYSIDKIYKEIASGMNDKRRELMKMFDNNPTKIIVEHKDRLTRFGFNCLEYFLKKNKCQIIVINKDNNNDIDLIKDLVSIITSFCCRLYGMRRGINKAKQIKLELNNEKN